MNEEIRAGMVLNLIEGLGPIRLHQLIHAFGSAQRALSADFELWAKHIGDVGYCEKLKMEIPRLFEHVDRELEQCKRLDVKILSSTSGPYPPLLKEIRIPPPILYVRGDISLEEPEGLAIVGSRRCSYYGSRVARRLARDLSDAGLATVSGLARGIDCAVHDETLLAGGLTVAVVGSGLDVCYPPENRALFDRILAKGAIVSEFPLGTHPLPGNFPRRNRIIAGMTRGTIVVEGTIKSGSLITAKIAANEGRDVFAVPGPITSVLSEASHLLLREGAVLVRGTADVIEVLSEDIRLRAQRPLLPMVYADEKRSGPEGEILLHLENESLSREALLERIKISAEQTAEILVRLELEGLVKSLPGGMLIRADGGKVH